jgi:hypothetical protein
MFALTSTTEKINVYRLADKMKAKGWYLQPKFARGNSPSNLHVSMNRSTDPQAEALLKALAETVADAHLHPRRPKFYRGLGAGSRIGAHRPAPGTCPGNAPVMGAERRKLKEVTRL